MKYIVFILMIFILGGCTPPVLDYYAMNIRGNNNFNIKTKEQSAIIAGHDFEIKVRRSFAIITTIRTGITIKNMSKQALVFDTTKMSYVISVGDKFLTSPSLGMYKRIIVDAGKTKTFHFGASVKGVYPSFTVSLTEIEHGNERYSFDVEFKADESEYAKYIKRFPWANEPENQEAIEKAITEQEGNITK